MSQLCATVTNIENVDNLNIVSFDFLGMPLKMMSLELSSEIQINTQVELCVKPTAVALGKEFEGAISYSNQISASIKTLEQGKLLCSVILNIQDNTLESIITTASAKRLDLKEQDKVTAFIKASDLSISKVLS